MLTCKQVAKNLADRDYAELPLLKRWGLKLHVMLCAVCGRHNQSVMHFQDGVRRYRCGAAAESEPKSEELRLKSDEREALKSAFAAQIGRSDGTDSPR